jgi:hypothetical protein
VLAVGFEGSVRFEVGDSTVLEAQVGAGGFESFVERAIIGDELTDPLFKSGVLVVIRWTSSRVHSASRSRIWPSSSRMRLR